MAFTGQLSLSMHVPFIFITVFPAGFPQALDSVESSEADGLICEKLFFTITFPRWCFS